jgi:hypothetical protein
MVQIMQLLVATLLQTAGQVAAQQVVLDKGAVEQIGPATVGRAL